MTVQIWLAVYLVGPERRSTELKVDGKIALVFEEGEDVDAVGGLPAVYILAVKGEQHVTNADAVALAEAHRQALVGDLIGRLNGFKGGTDLILFMDDYII